MGLKPSRGATPCGPLFGNHLLGIAGELVIARSVRDVAAALDAFGGTGRGPDPDPDLGGPALPRLREAPPPLRIGVCAEGREGMPIDDDRAEAVLAAAAALGRDGHALVDIPAGRLTDLCDRSAFALDRILAVNLARNLARFGEDELQLVEPLTRAVVTRGRALDAVGLFDALSAAAGVAHALWRLFDEVDVLLTPMLATPPLLIGAFPMDGLDVDAHWRRSVAFAPYVALANASGAPALSVPFGTDQAGLPIPLQLVAPIGGDALLLRIAERWACDDTPPNSSAEAIS